MTIFLCKTPMMLCNCVILPLIALLVLFHGTWAFLNEFVLIYMKILFKMIKLWVRQTIHKCSVLSSQEFLSLSSYLVLFICALFFVHNVVWMKMRKILYQNHGTIYLCAETFLFLFDSQREKKITPKQLSLWRKKMHSLNKRGKIFFFF